MIGLIWQGFTPTFGNAFGNIELDAVLEESHEWSAVATSNPVEDGSPISDHVTENPDKITIRGFVSDAPLVSQSTSDLTANTQKAFDLLRFFIKLREPMIVYTKHRTYSDMVLTSVRLPRGSGDGEALEFTAEFVNIRKVATQIVDVPPGISPKREAKKDKATANKTAPSKDAGKTSSTNSGTNLPKSIIKLIAGG